MREAFSLRGWYSWVPTLAKTDSRGHASLTQNVVPAPDFLIVRWPRDIHGGDASGIWGDRKSCETRMADHRPREVSGSGLMAVKDLAVVYSFVAYPRSICLWRWRPPSLSPWSRLALAKSFLHCHDTPWTRFLNWQHSQDHPVF